MKLPNADRAFVEQEKVVEYLLNPVHRYGASKARFFGAFGFRAEQWETFARALREHGQEHDVVKVHETGFGPRYEWRARFALQTAGARLCVRFGKRTMERSAPGSLRSILWRRGYD